MVLRKLNSNKYDTVLRFKNSMFTSKSTPIENPPSSSQKVNEYGETVQTIADKYGVGPNVIIRLLRSNGVKIKSSRWDYSSD